MYRPYLAHYGVKGMKWGFRRYQKKDGSLTQAGKKRYRDSRGFLTKEGRKQKKANDRRLYEKSEEVRSKISKDSDYQTARSNLQKSRKENHNDYMKNLNDFLEGKDFSGLSYEEFKDASYDRWIGSEAGKREAAARNNFRSVLERKVHETLGDKVFNQPLPELTTSFRKTLGEDIINRIFNTELYNYD